MSSIRDAAPLERLQYVAVDIHGLADGRVAQGLHDDAGMDALREQEAGAGVAQVVEPHRGQTGSREMSVERPQDISTVQRRADDGSTSGGTPPTRHLVRASLYCGKL